MFDLTNFKIEMYADGADLENIKVLRGNPLVKGFTTNPTLMKAAGILDYETFAQEAVKIVAPLPISLEVFADDLIEMKRQALTLNQIGQNVFIKIPITNTRGESTSSLIKSLSAEGVKLNITAVFTHLQVEEILKSIKPDSNTIISIFAGRIADAGVNPNLIVIKAIEMSKNFPNTKILWASPREIFNLVEAENCGCHIITMTPDLWKKMSNLGKDLNQFSLETVQMFYNDALASGFKL